MTVETVHVAPTNNIAADQAFIAKRWPTEWQTVALARESRNTIILGLNAEGWTQRRIADAVECSQMQVARVLKHFVSNGAEVRKDPRGGARNTAATAPANEAAPVAKPDPRRKLTDGQAAEMAELYKTGESLDSLGKAYGVHASTAANELRAQGVKIRPRGGTSNQAALFNELIGGTIRGMATALPMISELDLSVTPQQAREYERTLKDAAKSLLDLSKLMHERSKEQ